MATHAINTGHEFPEITNMTLIKHIPHKGTIMNIWEDLQIYKHKTNLYLNKYKSIQNMTQFSKHSTSKLHKIVIHTPQSHTIIPI